MKLYALSLLIALFSSIVLAGDQVEQPWISTDHALLGKWASYEVIGIKADEVFVEIVLSQDGSVKTSITRSNEEKNGKVEKDTEVMIGKFAIGKHHLYIWTAGPPEGFETDEPEKHIQSQLFVYRLENEELTLSDAIGKRDDLVIKLKKK